MAKDYISLDYSNKKLECYEDDENEKIYFGKGAIDRLKIFIKNNYMGQKIIVLCSPSEFDYISSRFYSDDYKICIISVVDYNNSFIERLGSTLNDVNLIVGVGDDRLVNLVKAIVTRYNVSYVLYLCGLCGYRLFINEYYLEENFSRHFECKGPSRVFIDEEKIETTSRVDVALRAFEVFSKLGYFADYILNFIVYKTEYNVEFVNEFKKLYKGFYNNLDKLIMMDKEAVKVLQDNIIELSELLNMANYSFEIDKENVFCNIYNYFDKEKIERPLLESVGFRVMLNIYNKFIININIQSTYFDIERHVAMFDKYFRNINIKMELEAMPEFKKLRFILEKAKDDINIKLNLLSKITEMIFVKCIKILPDNGYDLSRQINTNLVERSIYFCGDIIKGESYLKIIRDFGVLDYEVE